MSTARVDTLLDTFLAGDRHDPARVATLRVGLRAIVVEHEQVEKSLYGAIAFQEQRHTAQRAALHAIRDLCNEDVTK